MQDEKFYIEEGRRLERRRFARVAFTFMVVFATAITLAILFHPDRLDLATSLDKTSTILNGIMTAFVAIIMSYLGVSTWEAVSSNKESGRTPFRAPPAPPASGGSVETQSASSTKTTVTRPETSAQPDLFPEN
jgi:uncharacterized membrane protein